MVILKDIDSVLQVCNSLSNENRLKLVLLLKDGKPRTLREISEITADYTNFKHRETLYNYVESLVESNILEKIDSNGRISYKLSHREIIIDLAGISL